MFASISEIILGLLLIRGYFERTLFEMFNLTCGECVADMGCAFVSLALLLIGLFLITDGIIIFWQFWRVGAKNE